MYCYPVCTGSLQQFCSSCHACGNIISKLEDMYCMHQPGRQDQEPLELQCRGFSDSKALDDDTSTAVAC